MALGWLIGVMVEVKDQPAPVRHFFAVRRDDRAVAEWKSIDAASLIGPIAVSPVGGLEPVHLVCPLSLNSIRNLGLTEGEVRPLGVRWPRRWVTREAPTAD